MSKMSSQGCSKDVVEDSNTEAGTESLEESITKGLTCVNEKILKSSLKHPYTPRLVAVTKTKPIEMILYAYHHGQRHFGENYVQELVEKSHHPHLVDLKDIRWHFIGHLQRNKCNNVISCPNLWAVETVDSERLANTLDASWGRKYSATDQKLRVFVQVNTSGETAKHGSSSVEVSTLVKCVIEQCTNLEFLGLMTIGKIGYDYSTGPNPDFEHLVETRKKLCQDLSLDINTVELSMGMSSDFEQAIEAGSTNVRIGSVIFGAREVKK